MNARRKRKAAGGGSERPPAWPGAPENVAPEDIDFEALAHVLANTCRRGGRTRQYHSLAAHAVLVSEEVEALDGLDGETRRRLALHALIACAPQAWFRGEHGGSQRAAERTGRLAAGIEGSVREAAGLERVLDDEHAELLRFVGRMAGAAELRDLAGADTGDAGGVVFPPLKRRIRPMDPGRAARLWIERFRALALPRLEPGAGAAEDNDGDGGDGAHEGTKEATETGGDEGRQEAA